MLHKLKTPLSVEKIKNIRAGDEILLSGEIYGARDGAHKRFMSAISENKELPFNLNDAVIFYVGPSPTSPGKKSGSAGPIPVEFTSFKISSSSLLYLISGLRTPMFLKAAFTASSMTFEALAPMPIPIIRGGQLFVAFLITRSLTIAASSLGAEAGLSIKR